jgi:hypothetical protein
MSFNSCFIDFAFISFYTGWVFLSVNSDNDRQALFGGCFFDECLDKLIIMEHLSAHCPVDMTKEAVFNGIPFRGIWWIMSDDNIKTDFFGEGL